MANTSLLDNLQLFLDTSARLLICTRESCKFALSNGPSRITTHLRDKHNISAEARKGLNKLLKSLSPVPLEPDDASPRADGSPEHDKLRVYEGFACINCQFRTINLPLTRRHQSNPPDDCCNSRARSAQPRRRRDLDPQFEYVYLQTWTTGSTRKYWIIKRGGSMVRQMDSPAVQAHLHGVLTREFNREHPPRCDNGGASSSIGRYDGIFVADALGGRDYYIGHGQQCGLDEDFVSSGEDEDRIACLVRLVDVMMSRCEETARRTSRHMLCWLRSTQASSIYSKPFTLVQPTSSTKYRLLLKRCLAMILRIYRLPHDKRLKVTGLALNRKQLQFLNAIWNHGAFTDWAALEELAGRYKHSAGYAQAAVAGRGAYSSILVGNGARYGF
ncbi:Protein of unknown function DUF3505 [Fusarium oxysporum f. sp. vasinfectum]|nr:Protein of unknown function DUF3505 [Fusarium oxysporum f. sp. vasinfectum]